MNDYILFMLNDATDARLADSGEHWGSYIAALRQSGQFDGGSSIGAGSRVRKDQQTSAALSDFTGFIRVRAASLEEAKSFLKGNPVYEAGGTVEIRELPRE